MPSNTFVFNNKIDAAYIHEMYETDYPYIETIFKTIVDGFDADLAAIQDNYQSGNLDLLRKSVHKVIPTFGFAGMLTVQQKCKEVENKCKTATSIKEIELDLVELIKNLKEAGAIITEDYKKLRSFNNSN